MGIGRWRYTRPRAGEDVDRKVEEKEHGRMNENHCYICGHELPAPPWSTQWIFEYCPCCGGQFGYDDASTKAIASYRQQWLEAGAPWFKPEKRPNDWSLKDQLAMISKELPPNILRND